MIPWLSCYAIATVVSAVALVIKLKMFREQIRLRRTEFVLDDEEESDGIVKLKKHTKRSTYIVMVYIVMAYTVMAYILMAHLLDDEEKSDRILKLKKYTKRSV